MLENIRAKLQAGLAPVHLEVINESHRHNVPAGSESHFKIIVASASFESLGLLQRHRQVYALLNDEMSRKLVHALALHTYTPAEWEKDSAAKASPPCLGGEKKS